jgi:hypothetical protein
LDIDTLMAKKFDDFAPMRAPLPISPEYRMRSWWE